MQNRNVLNHLDLIITTYVTHKSMVNNLLDLSIKKAIHCWYIEYFVTFKSYFYLYPLVSTAYNCNANDYYAYF